MPELGEVDFTVPVDGSIEEVRDLIRAARADGDDRHYTVLIEDGEYSITQIVFDERDRDTTYRSRDGGVVLNGGVSLDPADFETPDDTVLERLSPKARRSVRVIDLTAMGLTAEDWGRLYATGAFNTSYKYDDAEGPAPCSLYYNNKRCTTARYPNSGEWLIVGEVIDIGDPQEFYGTFYEGWDQLRNPRGGTFAMDKKAAARTATWASLDDAWMFGLFAFEWADMTTPVKAIDHQAGTVTTEYASVFGFEENRTYYFFNVLEELDEPGEWYLDREAGLLYLWPPEENFENARINLALGTPVLIAGEDLDGLRFIGLTLQGNRSSAISLRGDNLTVSHCLVQNTGNGISVSGYNNTVADNEVRHIGAWGISIGGGDGETLTPGNSKAVNNLVHDWAEVQMTYASGIWLGGVGNLAAHNELYNTPHQAISFGGPNQVLEHNLIYDVCLITDDAGVFYTGFSWADSQGTVIRNNVIYNAGSGRHTPDGVYLDAGHSGVAILNNLLVNVPDNALHLNSGRDLDVRGNMVVNSKNPVSYPQHTRDGALGIKKKGDWIHLTGPGGQMWTNLENYPRHMDIWREAFPKLAAYSTDFADIEDPSFAANPAGSVVTGNIIVGLNPPQFSEAALRFSEIGPNEEYGVLRTRSYWNLPGFEMIEIEKAGRVAAYE